MSAKMGRKPRNKAQINAVREKIINHALKLFQNEGYEAISMRRLAKQVGCAPMTIYAHFDGKINILQHLWAVVLETVFSQIHNNIKTSKNPTERLNIAAQTFAQYWIENPDHFRLVFMSAGITRPDVDSFLKNKTTLSHFKFFSGLVMLALADTHTPNSAEVKAKTDGLISALIGIVFCANTIADYPWTKPEDMVNLMLTTLLTSKA
ncbi:MAG: TetR/AcrR family transcriptional regulator [Alphaproteobacteria bacterium]|nr:TetR/AcrR family transcriptional regulator [Alphaproteobacteria bacterium]